MTNNFQPILLGSDINVYGMARAFHEAYGITSWAYAHFALVPTRNSSIVEVTTIPGFDQLAVFRDYLASLGKRLTEQNALRGIEMRYLLIPCGDVYASMLSQCRDELTDYFVFNTLDNSLAQQLANKASFYELCSAYQLPHPQTVVFHKSDLDSDADILGNLPFGFPVAVKPADSVEYLDIDFPGRKKAYILNNREELTQTLEAIYGAGYTAEMIIQDFIPGDDSNMRVLNAYVDQHHHVRMMFLGHPLLEDPSPVAVGNYSAILPDFNQGLFERIKDFLEAIGYEGVANFDLKYDRRDGEYKLFEINLRQGRSSYFVTLNGFNLASYFVDDLVDNAPFDGSTVFGKGSKLWLEVPVSVFKKYTRDNDDKRRALTMLQNGDWGSTLKYPKDMNLMRRAYLHHLYSIYKKNYRKYFTAKED